MTFKDIIKKSVLEGFSTNISTSQILVVLGVSLILGIYVFYIYRLKSKNTFYSKDFNVVLAALPIVTAGIVLAMQSSVVISLGMVGALSIVRFRNAVKSPLDLLFLFWSISVGIVCGAGIFDIAIYVSAVVTLLLFLLDLLPAAKASLLLVVNGKDISIEESLNKLLKKHTNNYAIKSRSINKNGVDYVIELKSKDTSLLFENCSKIDGVINLNILSHDGERKY